MTEAEDQRPLSAASRQTQVTNPREQTTVNLYDSLGRVYQRQYANGAITNHY